MMADALRGAVRPDVRIGAVTYLNSRPLVCALAELAPRAEIVVDLPSRLADALAARRLDVALIPSIEYARHSEYAIVSDACVACDGPVRSVMLYSRVPIERVKSLALDEGSRTSAALARILLKERFGLEPEIHTLPIGAGPDAWTADAAVLIGDRGMKPAEGRFETVWDLGDVWAQWTGVPFVFSMWVGRHEAASRSLSTLLARARDLGVGRIDQLARQAAGELGLDEQDCLDYLRRRLHYRLGPRQWQGLARFFELAVRNGLAPPGAERAFQNSTPAR